MSTFQYIMLGFGVVFALKAPIVLVKAIRRKEWQRLYELVVSSLFTLGFVLSVVFPVTVQNAWSVWPALRWMYLLSAVLMLIHIVGFSGWLFNWKKVMPSDNSTLINERASIAFHERCVAPHPLV